MDFLQKFIEVALGRMLSGETSAAADGGQISGTDWMGVGRDVYDFGNSIVRPDRSESGTEQAQSTMLNAETLVGDYFAGGQVGNIRRAAERVAPGLVKKLEGVDRKINPTYHWLGKLFPGRS